MERMKKFHFNNAFFDNPLVYDDILLYQVGDLSCEGEYIIQEHDQFCYEISYIVSGSGIFYTNNKSYTVKRGDIYLSLPGEIHSGVADKTDPYRFFYMGMDFKDKIEGKNPLSHIRKMLNNIKIPVMEDRLDVRTPFTNMFNEIINAKSYNNLMMKTYLYQIVVLTYRNFFKTWEKEYLPKNHFSESEKIVYDIINYIDVNLHKTFRLSDIASEIGYNYSYISRVFSHETGFSIQNYYKRKRFEMASVLLKKSDLSITHIAEELHYHSIHSFSRAFRLHFGISPTEYQLLCKKKIEQ